MKMINKTDKELSIVRQCGLLSINRASFYYRPFPKDADTVTLMNEIQDLWERYPFYGYRRITATLRRSGYNVNHKRVYQLKGANLQVWLGLPCLKPMGSKLVWMEKDGVWTIFMPSACGVVLNTRKFI